MNRLRNLRQRKLHAERLETRTLLAADGPVAPIVGASEMDAYPIERAVCELDLVVASVAAESAQQVGRQQVPFQGSFDATVSSFVPINATTATVSFLVDGHGTHLGRFTGYADTVFNLADLTYQGTYEWTAANGDTVFGQIAGSLIPTATQGLFDNVETFTIDGGTGRFQSASGSGSAGGQINLITGVGEIPFHGIMSRPNSG